jgi:hypothetical protein
MERDIKYLKITKPHLFRFVSLCIFVLMNLMFLYDELNSILSSHFIYFISYLYTYYVSCSALFSSLFLKSIHMEKSIDDLYIIKFYLNIKFNNTEFNLVVDRQILIYFLFHFLIYPTLYGAQFNYKILSISSNEALVK